MSGPAQTSEPTPLTARFAINLGNPALAHASAGDGQLHGISVDLAAEIGQMLGRAVELVRFPSAGAVIKGLDEQAWDVAFLAVDPARAEQVAYTRPYMSLDGVFATRPGNSIETLLDVDRVGVKIASAAGAAYTAHLSRNLHKAELVMAPTPSGAMDFLASGACEVAAGVRQGVEAFAARNTAVTILPVPFVTIHQAIAVPRHQTVQLRALDEFLEAISQSGRLSQMLRQHLFFLAEKSFNTAAVEEMIRRDLSP